mmetsp:Transcript_56293/g.89383  ORF Transcript_56293/g.89383 Transcript_56293/m.89383 type:complete len:257 (+) Transcript_56293:24-794(+)
MSIALLYPIAVLVLFGSVGAILLFLVWMYRANQIPTDLPARLLTVFDDLPQKPRKISLVGNTGSGKSTLSEALESNFGLVHIDLDRMYWSNEVRNTDLKPLRKAIKDATQGWVCDGVYKAAVLEAWGRSDVILLLDPPSSLRMFRALRREWRIYWRGETNQVGAKGLLRLAWSAVICLLASSGLGRQRRALFEHIRSFQIIVRENYHRGVQKREQQRQNGQTPKETWLRESVPVLLLRSDHEVQMWLNLYHPCKDH